MGCCIAVRWRFASLSFAPCCYTKCTEKRRIVIWLRAPKYHLFWVFSLKQTGQKKNPYLLSMKSLTSMSSCCANFHPNVSSPKENSNSVILLKSFWICCLQFTYTVYANIPFTKSHWHPMIIIHISTASTAKSCSIVIASKNCSEKQKGRTSIDSFPHRMGKDSFTFIPICCKKSRTIFRFWGRNRRSRRFSRIK